MQAQHPRHVNTTCMLHTTHVYSIPIPHPYQTLPHYTYVTCKTDTNTQPHTKLTYFLQSIHSFVCIEEPVLRSTYLICSQPEFVSAPVLVPALAQH